MLIGIYQIIMGMEYNIIYLLYTSVIFLILNNGYSIIYNYGL